MKKKLILLICCLGFGFLQAQNCGVNQNSPINCLDVNGNASIGSGYSGTNTAPTNGLIVEGNVGIGTSTPSQKLEVAGAGKISGNLEIGNNLFFNNASNKIYDNSNTLNLRALNTGADIHLESDNDIRAYMNGMLNIRSSQVIIEGPGGSPNFVEMDVINETAGFGTSSASSTTVAIQGKGSTNATRSLLVRSGMNNTMISVSDDERIGFKTGNPATDFDFNGNMKIEAGKTFYCGPIGTGGNNARIEHQAFDGKLTFHAKQTANTDMNFYARRSMDFIGTNGSILLNTPSSGGDIDIIAGDEIVLDAADEIEIRDAGVAWMKIDCQNREVGIGTTSPSSALDVVGDLEVSGQVEVGGSVVHPSDIRFKREIVPVNGALSKVEKLQGVTYFWKLEQFPERNFSKDKQIGLIAQELEKVFPELVIDMDDGYKTVNYTGITPVLIEAIKEQQAIINAQQSQIDALNANTSNFNSELASLKAMMIQLQAANEFESAQAINK